MTGDFPTQWEKWLSLVKLWYNTTYHFAIGMTPFQAIYGVAPPSHLPYLAGDSHNEVVDRLCLSRELTIQLLKDYLLKAQERMVHQANKHRSKLEFAVSDFVFLKLQLFPRNLLTNSSLHKLATCYFRPFAVLKRIGKVAYELKLPPETKMHPVFHVSLLKGSLRFGVSVSPSLLQIDDEDYFTMEPVALLGCKLVKQGYLPVTQILVNWRHTRPEDATWEDLTSIQRRFLNFSMNTSPSLSILVVKDAL